VSNPIIYVAGPYRASTESGVFDNIIEARRISAELWRQGWTPLCPHLNSAFMGGIVPDEEFLSRDLVLLSRCDAIFADPYTKSKGTLAEIEYARQHGIRHVELLSESHYLLEEFRRGTIPMRFNPTPTQESKQSASE
jgi:hypothetical protein